MLQRVERQGDEGEPHEAEADPTSGTHVLAEHEHAAQQLHDRRHELQQPDRRQRDATGSGGEQQQRDGRRDAAEGEQNAVRDAVPAPRQILRRQHEQQQRGGQRREDDGLRCQPFEGAEVAADALLHEAVCGERQREGDGDPRRAAVVDREVDARDDTDRDGEPLQTPQLLTEHEDAEHHRHERVEEVPERGLGDVAARHGDDVDRPVRGDEQRRDGDGAEPGRVPEQPAQEAQIAGDRQQDETQQQRPQDAMAEDLPRARRFEGMEVQRKQTPRQVGEEAVDRALALLVSHASPSVVGPGDPGGAGDTDQCIRNLSILGFRLALDVRLTQAPRQP